MERARSFGTQALRYDRARPAYPGSTVEAVLGLVETEAPRVLEVGCGTGILTRQLTQRGCTGIATDPDASMLAVARDRAPNDAFSYEQCSFEECSAAGPFDLVVAGQSWHWVEADIGYPKAFGLLRPGGAIALLWNRPSEEGFEFRPEIDEVYARLAPALSQGSSQAFTLGLDERLEHLVIPDPFVGFVRTVHPWSTRRTTEQYLDLLQTHSDHIQLDADTGERLLAAVGDVVDANGGSIETSYQTLLVAARKPADQGVGG